MGKYEHKMLIAIFSNQIFVDCIPECAPIRCPVNNIAFIR